MTKWIGEFYLHKDYRLVLSDRSERGEFSAEDLRIMCDRLSVHSKVYDIVWQWKKMGIIEQAEKKHYKKCDVKKTTYIQLLFL